jgi:hypothetical protein
MTYSLVQDAKGHPENEMWWGKPPFLVDSSPGSQCDPHPKYYLWLPLFVPADIVSLPFQTAVVVVFGGTAYLQDKVQGN